MRCCVSIRGVRPRSARVVVAAILLAGFLIGCSPAPRYTGSTHSNEGIASYYAHEFHGRQTANGEIYDIPTKPRNVSTSLRTEPPGFA